MTNSISKPTRRRKSPLTGRYWTMPAAAVEGYERYRKEAKTRKRKEVRHETT